MNNPELLKLAGALAGVIWLWLVFRGPLGKIERPSYDFVMFLVVVSFFAVVGSPFLFFWYVLKSGITAAMVTIILLAIGLLLAVWCVDTSPSKK